MIRRSQHSERISVAWMIWRDQHPIALLHGIFNLIDPLDIDFAQAIMLPGSALT
jgi:hypothetical protein